LSEANEALDELHNIVRNKHPAAGTGLFQPAGLSLSPFLKLLHWIEDHTTAKNQTANALKNSEEREDVMMMEQRFERPSLVCMR
jgi:hypothetical protein